MTFAPSRETLIGSSPRRIRRSPALIVVGVAALALAACGSAPDVAEQRTSTKPTAAPTPTPSEQPEDEQGDLIESGFAHMPDYEYVTAVALIENKSDHVGQSVTVNFNAKDASGNLLATATGSESFSWVGQKVVVAAEIDAPDPAEVASVDATMVIEDLRPGAAPKPEIPAAEVGPDDMVKATNPDSEPAEYASAGVICHDASGAVVGGGKAVFKMIPPNGEALQEASLMQTSGERASCTAYVNY